VIADAGGGGARQAIEANDNYWVHAYGTDGGEAPGFPKYTGQWVGFSGAMADPRMNGQLHYATITREGDLFDWRVKGSSKLNDSWWHYRHDERNSGLFGLDTRRPAVVRSLRARRLAHGRVRLTWRAPGDDYAVGRAKRYEVRVGGRRLRGPKPLPAGKRQTLVVRLPRHARSVSVRAIDDAGNIGARATARVR
jgi:hypothetical protein